VIDWLRKEDYRGPLIVMGRSLGSASALELAFHHSEALAGIIIESGFAYLGPLLDLIGVPLSVAGISEEDGRFNIEKIKTFHKATLIIHAQYDQVIPFGDAKALYEASGSAVKRLVMIPGADHNTIFAQGLQIYMSAIADFAKVLTPVG